MSTKTKEFAIKDIVKDNTVRFHYYRAGKIFYAITIKEGEYMFPVSIDDVGDASLMSTDKAIYMMRYINLALKEGTFVPFKDEN